ncbi:MAG: ribosome biogenesis GTP-binding protein YihA/YsxC [Bacteroidales bacterium]
MIIRSASFLLSVTDVKHAPKRVLPEYAFIGRSNVGKSSLINMLTGRKKLARTSVTPGKTTLINYFLIDDGWYLVDLPGYGFAKRSKSERGKWSTMIQQYLLNRKNLACSFLLMDSRLDPQQKDMDFLNWLGACELPVAIVFTKADKSTKNKLHASLEKYRDHLYEYWEELPRSFVSSTVTEAGKEDILNFIAENNKAFREHYR